jgi:hypothetical protein
MADMAPERGREMRLARRSRRTELESGGHLSDAILTNAVLPATCQDLLTRMLQRRPVVLVHVAVKHGDFDYRFESRWRNSMGRTDASQEVRS